MRSILGIVMKTRLAAYRNEIARLHLLSDGLCGTVSTMLRHIARKSTAHAEEVAKIRA